MLRHPLHSGHLTVGALKRHRDKPVLFLGETTLTGGELADRISQYVQAFEALGAGTGPIVSTCLSDGTFSSRPTARSTNIGFGSTISDVTPASVSTYA